MKCIHCDNTLTDKSEVCPFCGKAPLIPDGFLPDSQSGLYYLPADAKDPETGKPVRLVTWFNPANGSYSQESFVLDFPVPEGFVPDEDKGLYRMTADASDEATGKPIRLITWFNPMDGSYSQETLPLDDAPDTADAPAENTVTDTGSVSPDGSVSCATQAEPETEAPPSSNDMQGQAVPVEADVPQMVEPISSPVAVAAPTADSGAVPQGPQTDSEASSASEALPDAFLEIAEPPDAVAQAEDSSREPELAAPPLEYEEVPEPKKKHTGAIVTTIVLLLLVGLGGAGYYFGYYDKLMTFVKSTEIHNVTTPPQGAVIPEFAPVDPSEIHAAQPEPEEDLTEPDDFEVPAQSDVVTSDSAIDYDSAPANLSVFSTRAMQDEDYIYFLPVTAGNNSTADLMRVPVGGSKPEYIPDCFPQTASVYSFTLLDGDIVVCAQKPETSVYGFYTIPKNGGAAKFLFEQASPALIEQYDGRLFMLFAAESRLGIFDPKNDSQPAFIDMRTESPEPVAFIPEFSVKHSYLYYGLSYSGGERVDYMRRSLYTGETSPVLGSSLLNESWTVNPVWDGSGGAYYGQYDRINGYYSLKSYKTGGSPESLFSYTFPATVDSLPPVLVPMGGNSFVAMSQPDTLRLYSLDNSVAVKESTLQGGRPYAATQNYLISQDGIYTVSDTGDDSDFLSYFPFEAPDPLPAPSEDADETLQ